MNPSQSPRATRTTAAATRRCVLLTGLAGGEPDSDGGEGRPRAARLGCSPSRARPPPGSRPRSGSARRCPSCPRRVPCRAPRARTPRARRRDAGSIASRPGAVRRRSRGPRRTPSRRLRDEHDGEQRSVRVLTPARKSAAPQRRWRTRARTRWARGSSVADHALAVFLDVLDALVQRVEGERVSVDDHEVRTLAGLDRPELVLQPHELGGARRGRHAAPRRA